MRTKNHFSIIEMMTVVLIVLLLMSLTIPLFVTLKQNARTAICKSQLRQIGVLMTSYASAYNGYLPNGDATNEGPGNHGAEARHNDLGWSNRNYSQLYSEWNGHLLPFIDTNIKDFTRGAKMTSDGLIRWTVYDTSARFIYQGYPGATGTDQPKDPLTSGWAVVNDAYEKGGFNDLKLFICPEIHSNTYDVYVNRSFLGLKIPRMKISESFESLNFWAMGGGIPTTYLANSYFFGRNADDGPNINSLRIDELSDISHKAFLIEGGLNGKEVYYRGGNGTNAYDLGLQVYDNGFGKEENDKSHKLSFVHDNHQEFWTSQQSNAYGGRFWSTETVAQFNTTFEGKAYMLPVFDPSHATQYHIVSFIDPQNGATFKPFFDSKNINATTYAQQPYTNFRLFEEPEYQYLAGNTNILFGDGSVSTKDQGWLYNNRERIAKNSKE